MKPDSFNTTTPVRIKPSLREKRFMRRPSQSSERSSSKKSRDSSSIKDLYIKSPTIGIRPSDKKQDFFASLASTILTNQMNSSHKKNQHLQRYEPQQTERTTQPQYQDPKSDNKIIKDFNQTNTRKLNIRISALQAELDLKNHQASVLSSQCQRLKKTVQQQKQKRRKIDYEKKELGKQLKQVNKNTQILKIEYRKIEKERQQLMKQIQFLQRINFDDKTRSLQSYRQNYLQQEVQKIRGQFHKSRGQRQQDLQKHIKVLKQQKYTMESHLKALKVANQCLIKQINYYQQGLQDIILNSQQYRKLRDKYIRFLEEYKLLRNEYWAIKAQMHQKKGINSVDQSQIFSITASQVQNDLSELKGHYEGTQILQYLPLSSLQTKYK